MTEPLLMKNHIIVGEVDELVKSAKVEGDCQSCLCKGWSSLYFFTSEGDPCRKDDWRPISIDGTMVVLPNYLVILQ